MNLATLVVLLTFGSASASMMAMREVPAPVILAHLKKSEHPQAKNMITLLQIGQQALDLKSVSLPDAGSDAASVRQLQVGSLSEAFDASLRSRADWAQPISAKALSAAKAHRALLEKSLSPSAVAWFQFQLGEKNEAKNALLAQFSEAYRRVMAMQDTGFGNPPMQEPEALRKALGALATPSELADLDAKMQKMKVHLSNLPQSMIMT